MSSAVSVPAASSHGAGDKRFRILDATMKRHQFHQDALIEVLHLAQDLFGSRREPASLRAARREGAQRAVLARIRQDDAAGADARRVAAAGVPAVQVTTGSLCHLEAGLVAEATRSFDLDRLDLLVVENVGNLVCPAAFDLGEDARIVLLSVTEGEDNPLKYPVAFKVADAIVLTKTDLTKAAGFDRALAMEHVITVAPRARLFEVSARTGQGLEAWYEFIWRHTRRRPAA